MDSVNKLTLRTQVGHGLKYAYQKIPLIIKTLVRLVSINAFDAESMKIRDSSGQLMNNTNILDLLSHAMSKGKNTVGANEFVKRLLEADVDPEWVINEYVRDQLINMRNSSGHRPPPPPPPVVRHSIPKNRPSISSADDATQQHTIPKTLTLDTPDIEMNPVETVADDLPMISDSPIPSAPSSPMRPNTPTTPSVEMRTYTSPPRDDDRRDDRPSKRIAIQRTYNLRKRKPKYQIPRPKRRPLPLPSGTLNHSVKRTHSEMDDDSSSERETAKRSRWVVPGDDDDSPVEVPTQRDDENTVAQEEIEGVPELPNESIPEPVSPEPRRYNLRPRRRNVETSRNEPTIQETTSTPADASNTDWIVPNESTSDPQERRYNLRPRKQRKK